MDDKTWEELHELVREKKFRKLRSILEEMNEVDIAEFLEELDPDRMVIVFRVLPKELGAEVFACLDIDVQEHIINSMSDYELQKIVEELYIDDTVDMLEELPATVVRRVLQNAKADTRALINQFLQYPDNSAGSIMTAEYIGLKKHMTVEQSFTYIRRHGVDKETIYTCFVIDDKRHLEGIVTVKDLLMNSYETTLDEIMDTNIIKAVTTEDREEVVEAFNRYGLLSLPVVDHENRLVGIVTVDDAVDVMEQEATEDIEKMAAILPSEKPYLKMSVFELAKNRAPWLLLLMFTSTISALILEKYEAAFAMFPTLVTCIPMLTATGGNAGSQSSTTIIRAMSIGDVQISDVWKVLWKECRVSLAVGMVLGTANYIRLVIMYPGEPRVCLVIGLSLVATVVMSKMLGCVLPVIAKIFRLDPAMMAAPLISTIVDALSLILYFTIAGQILHINV
ncbi:MAG: magnesium transporter [Lachnospiraceae bacterium]